MLDAGYRMPVEYHLINVYCKARRGTPMRNFEKKP